MKKNLFIPKLCFVSLAFILAQSVSYAMPSMHGSGSGAAMEHPRVSNSIGGKINSSRSEIEITYSADGKTAIFVSTREGSIQSPGDTYSFDIWMSHQVDGEWQEQIHLGPNINTSAWELEPSFSDDGKCDLFYPLRSREYVVRRSVRGAENRRRLAIGPELERRARAAEHQYADR